MGIQIHHNSHVDFHKCGPHVRNLLAPGFEPYGNNTRRYQELETDGFIVIGNDVSMMYGSYARFTTIEPLELNTNYLLTATVRMFALSSDFGGLGKRSDNSVTTPVILPERILFQNNEEKDVAFTYNFPSVPPDGEWKLNRVHLGFVKDRSGAKFGFKNPKLVRI